MGVLVMEYTGKAEPLNAYFASVFTTGPRESQTSETGRLEKGKCALGCRRLGERMVRWI